MHEIGHNLNLGHSGLDVQNEYTDKSGVVRTEIRYNILMLKNTICYKVLIMPMV